MWVFIYFIPGGLKIIFFSFFYTKSLIKNRLPIFILFIYFYLKRVNIQMNVYTKLISSYILNFYVIYNKK